MKLFLHGYGSLGASTQIDQCTHTHTHTHKEFTRSLGNRRTLNRYFLFLENTEQLLF